MQLYSVNIHTLCISGVTLTAFVSVITGAALSFHNSGGYYPKYPLTFTQLNEILMQNQSESQLYYEIYSLDPKDLNTTLPLPVLRKVVIRWNLKTTGYTNNYAGWFPTSNTCVTNEIPFITSPGRNLEFKFLSEFPTQEWHTGTIFSSHPERYHINWYCPESQLVGHHRHIKCLKHLRMSIYSAHGHNNLPWDLIVEDLCKNKAPAMDDPRWVMTYDAPKQCTFENSRKRRDVNI